MAFGLLSGSVSGFLGWSLGFWVDFCVSQWFWVDFRVNGLGFGRFFGSTGRFLSRFLGQFLIPRIHSGAGLRAGGSWPYLVRVPVAVKDDDSVGRLQVEAQAPGPRAQQEDEILRARLVECLQQHSPVLCLRGPWNPTRASFLPPSTAARGAGGSRVVSLGMGSPFPRRRGPMG